MKDSRHILRELARCYERTQAGRTGQAERDLLLDYEPFLSAAGCADGDGRLIAEQELLNAQRDGILTLVSHPRDPKLIQQIRFNRNDETSLFARIGESSPTERRQKLSQQFATATQYDVPDQWREAWAEFCTAFAQAAGFGKSVSPFERDAGETNAELLRLTPQLLAWRGESLLRFASCVLCKDSKRLEALSGRLGQILERLTEGKICSLEQVGILANPRFALLHGPIKLLVKENWLDLGLLIAPFRLSETEITQATALESSARRCLTVENETTFHELAKLNSGNLLIQTSFPGSGTLALLRRLSGKMEFWHFGDTDVEGFEILRDLRQRSGRNFRALHMHYRANPDSLRLGSDDRRKIERLLKSEDLQNEWNELEKMLSIDRMGLYEQENLGIPTATWPFYPSRPD